MYRTSIFIFSSLALLTFSNVASAQGEFVPIAQVLSETSSRPYECGEYDKTTNTCTSLATMEILDGMLINESSFEVGPAPVVRFYATSQYQIQSGWVCGNQKDMVLTAESAGSQRDRRRATKFVRRDLANMGKVCVGYFRVGKAEYEVRFNRYSGQPIPDRTTKVTFLSNPVGLRP